MNIINHGSWDSYQPKELPTGAPINTLFCKRKSDGVDWYEYRKNISSDTVKCTVFMDRVQAVFRDVSMMFPQDCTVIEIDDLTTEKPFKKYRNMKYDPEMNTLV